MLLNVGQQRCKKNLAINVHGVVRSLLGHKRSRYRQEVYIRSWVMLIDGWKPYLCSAIFIDATANIHILWENQRRGGGGWAVALKSKSVFDWPSLKWNKPVYQFDNNQSHSVRDWRQPSDRQTDGQANDRQVQYFRTLYRQVKPYIPI